MFYNVDLAKTWCLDVFKEDGEDNEKEEVEFIHVN